MTLIFTADIYYCITPEFDYAKLDSRLAAYHDGGVALQLFGFTKVCIGENGNRHCSRNFDILAKKIITNCSCGQTGYCFPLEC